MLRALYLAGAGDAEDAVRAQLAAAGPAGAGAPPRSGAGRPDRPAAREDASLELPALPPLAAALPPFDATLRLAGNAAVDAPFTLAGLRTLAAGGEARGVDAVWIHPLRVVEELRHAGAQPLGFEATPVGIERRLRVGGREAAERILVPRDLPAAILEWRTPGGAELALEWRTDLRVAWPYPAGALGPLRWKRDGRALLVRAEEPDVAAVFVLSREPDAWDVDGVDSADAPAVRARLRLRLAPGESVRLAVAATMEGDAALAATLAALRPDALVHARAAVLRRIRRERLEVDAPDERAGAALEWAKYRLDAFRVEMPGLGRTLAAGYGAGRGDPGDGRAGHVWTSARDAVWTALGSLACGDFDAARDVIRFLGEHQDRSGKILDEATTSGVVRVDAADASPLYLLLVARTLAWTGDCGFVREQWERVKRAYAFCLSADADGDGPIESTRAGHGGAGPGRAGGGTVTHDGAAIRATAFAELAIAAESIGDQALADDLRARAARARRAADAHVVSLLLGPSDPHGAARWLDAIAADGFTAPCGGRIVPAPDPRCDGASSHGGAVCALCTGWVSWAEYIAGRGEAAFRHWWHNVEACFARAKGAWGEALQHGPERRAAGACPDHACSAAMAASPFVYGLLGAEPDAVKGRLRLRPQIPAAWDRLDVRRLRMGDATVSLGYTRAGDRHVFRLVQDEGAVPITVVFEPMLPARRLVAARVDGQPAELDARPHGERMRVPVQLVLDAERVVELDVADEPAPQPAGLRVWRP
ncbi:MAG TPA: hypothetical protein VF158_08590 [Longimicrobiales bacterium]